MQTEMLKDLISNGLAAMKAGSDVAAKATSEIQNDASNEMLKDALKEGNQTSQQWAMRLDNALKEAGANVTKDNPILEAHYEVSRRIRQEAKDDTVRDLGIIAAGQLALHYWIASFGTMRTYAEKAGLQQTSDDMQSCLDEAKEADERHNEIAAQIMGSDTQRNSRNAEMRPSLQ